MSHAGHPPPPPKPPDGWQKSLNEAAATTADVTKTSIIALRDSTDAFPPVKSLAGGVLAVWETAERASSKQRAKDLDERCCSFLMIADAVKDPNDVLPEMNDKLENFKIRLEDIRSTLNPLRKQKWLKSLAHLNRDQDELDDVKRRLDEAYDNVMISRMLMIHRDVAKTPIKLGHIDKAQDCIIARLSEIRNEVSSSNREPAEICRELATKLEAIDRDRGLTHLTYLFTISVVLF